MNHPYPADQAVRLTAKGAATYRTLNERDGAELIRLGQIHVELAAELASVADVMADLQETITRREAKIRGDAVSLLPVGAELHQAMWTGDSSPETGMFTAPDLSSDPDANIQRLNELHDAQNQREGVHP